MVLDHFDGVGACDAPPVSNASIGGEIRGKSPRASRQALDVLTAAAWLALATGYCGSTFWLIKQHVFQSLVCLNSDYWWMSPAFQLALFSVPACLLAVVAWRRPRWDVLIVSVTTLSLLSWLNLLLLAPPIHVWAWILAACGLATVSGRLFQKCRGGCLTVMRWSLAPMLGVLIVAPLVQTALERSRERAVLAALPPPPARAPNILLIVLDAVRADALELYGADREVAPHLAALARQGVTFEQAWSTAPWTLPSQAGMFTGCLPDDLSADWLSALDDTQPTLAEALTAGGWQCGGFVGNTHYCSTETGLARGFSHYEDYRHSLTDFALCTALGRRWLLSAWSVDLGMHDRPARKRAAEVSEGLKSWLARREDRPYFAFLNYFEAHEPYVPLPGYETRKLSSRDEALLIRHWWWLSKEEVTSDQIALLRGAYEDCIRGLDAHVGQLLQDLERSGDLENTIIVITADHGEHFGGHDLFLHGNSLYQPLIHVPLIVVWKGRIPSGVRVEAPVSLAGLPNTLMELIGVERRFPGNSWAAHWSPEGPGLQQPEVIAAEIGSQPGHPPCHGHSPIARGPMQCLRKGNIKYIRNGDGGEELYDLGGDPTERVNLAQDADHHEMLLEMRSHWEKHRGIPPRFDLPRTLARQ